MAVVESVNLHGGDMNIRRPRVRFEAGQGNAVAKAAEFSSSKAPSAILSLGGESSLWVEPVTVRERIGAWVFGQLRATGQPGERGS